MWVDSVVDDSQKLVRSRTSVAYLFRKNKIFSEGPVRNTFKCIM